MIEHTQSIDSGLQPAEYDEISKHIPPFQHFVHMDFHADLIINKVTSPDGVVILTEHMVTFFNHDIFDKSLKVLKPIYLIEILKVKTENNEVSKLFTKSLVIEIHAKESNMFIRTLLRNYTLAYPMLPKQLRFEFQTHNPDLFPFYVPRMSPSQFFQFQYNSNCAFYMVKYCHEVAQYFHQLVKTGNAIFDFNQLPIHLLMNEFGKLSDLRPITLSLMFSICIMGINCDNIKKPDIIQNVSSIIMTSKKLKVVRLVNTECRAGAAILGSSLFQNSSVVYWDLSGNMLEDMSQFMIGLSKVTNQILSLKFERCAMNSQSLSLLLSAISNNTFFYGLRQLCLAGNRMDEKVCNEFANLLEKFQNINQKHISSISLGPVDSISLIVHSINICDQPISKLKFYAVTFDKSSVDELCLFLYRTYTLTDLEFECCSFMDGTSLLQKILKSLSENNRISEFNLGLNHMRLIDDYFNVFIASLKGGLGKKLISLSLDKNRFSVDELKSFVENLSYLPKLENLSLAGNFNRNEEIGYLLTLLLDKTNLKYLNLNGLNVTSLESEILKIIKKIATNKTITRLDISSNNVGNEIIPELTEMLKLNQTINVVKFDSNKITDLNLLNEYITFVSDHKSLVTPSLPLKDATEILKDKEEEVIESFGMHYFNSQKQLICNSINAGIHSELTYINDPILDLILDKTTADLQSVLSKTNTNVHLSVSSINGLPYPFENSKSEHTEPEETFSLKSVNEPSNVYTPSSYSFAVGKCIPRTLLFNNLCSKNPDIYSQENDPSINEFTNETQQESQASNVNEISEEEEDDDNGIDFLHLNENGRFKKKIKPLSDNKNLSAKRMSITAYMTSDDGKAILKVPGPELNHPLIYSMSKDGKVTLQ